MMLEDEMKAVCIVGSARSNGSSNYLIDTIINGMAENGIETKKYCISEMNIQYCLGCKKCYVDGKCVQNDDVYQIVYDMLSADYIVIAAPSYWADVPGQLKVFFDRNTPFGDTNPNRVLKAEKKIKGIAIAIRAGMRQAENDLILNSIEHYFGHLGIETVRKFSVLQTNTLDELMAKNQDIVNEIYETGKCIK